MCKIDMGQRAQHFAELALIANQADDALLASLNGRLNDRGMLFIQRGIALCKTLERGRVLIGRQMTVSDLPMVEDFLPLQETSAKEAANIEKAAGIFEKILRAGGKCALTRADVRWTSDFVNELFNAYLAAADKAMPS